MLEESVFQEFKRIELRIDDFSLNWGEFDCMKKPFVKSLNSTIVFH